MDVGPIKRGFDCKEDNGMQWQPLVPSFSTAAAGHASSNWRMITMMKTPMREREREKRHRHDSRVFLLLSFIRITVVVSRGAREEERKREDLLKRANQ